MKETSPPSDARETAKLALSLLDLTSLNDHDTAASISLLAGKSVTPHGAVAGLCVHRRWVGLVRKVLDELGAAAQGVRIVTVSAFPGGRADAATAERETAEAAAAGADEVDTVLPYRAFLAGEHALCEAQLRACREACGKEVKLKVILETGELRDSGHIAEAARLALGAGADFLKTSTGKTPVSATPESVAVLLRVLAESGSAATCGLKIAGGVRTLPEARAYLEQAAAVMGEGFLHPETFRFGASGLLETLRAELGESGPLRTPSSAY